MPVYSDRIFRQPTLEGAKAIILTPDGETTNSRWRRETPHFIDLIVEHTKPPNGTWLVMDFGAGIGRLSKPLIEDHGACVIGIDSSPDMRDFSLDYVGRGHPFEAISPEDMAQEPLFDTAVAVWVIQHVVDPKRDLENLYRALKPGGKLFMINCVHRCVPVDPATNGGQAFADDGLNVAQMFRELFTEPDGTKHFRFGGLNPMHIGTTMARVAYWAVGTKPWSVSATSTESSDLSGSNSNALTAAEPQAK